ncbi:MAG TPA: DUF1801 domain-containing protein [Vicinamibacteria bacterium]|nr:DUF1801 domain-containing protein [Vicinamibacteria bacterium]
MAELKTKRTARSVDDFLRGIKDEARQKDCRTLVTLLKQATGARPEMWGTSIVGFGSYHYKYASGREADWFLKQMGKHTTSVSCLYLKSLADVDMGALKQLVARSVAETRKRFA